MFQNAINKEIIEFSYSSEDIARKVQAQIEYYTIPHFNAIISSIFSKEEYSQSNLKIDSLEIDLGDIHSYDLDNGHVLNIFREKFQKQIADTNRSKSNKIKSENDKKLIGFMTVMENELELIRTFIASGNVPWWINKNEKIDIDSIIQNLLQHSPESFKKLMEEFIGNPDHLLRLFLHLRPNTHSIIEEQIPLFSRIIWKDEDINKNISSLLNLLSIKQKTEIKKHISKQSANSNEKLSLQLTKVLVQLNKLLQINKTIIKDSILERLLHLLDIKLPFSILEGTEPVKALRKKKKIVFAVDALTVFERELLWFELSRYFAEAKLFYEEKPIIITLKKKGLHSLITAYYIAVKNISDKQILNDQSEVFYKPELFNFYIGGKLLHDQNKQRSVGLQSTFSIEKNNISLSKDKTEQKENPAEIKTENELTNNINQQESISGNPEMQKSSYQTNKKSSNLKLEWIKENKEVNSHVRDSETKQLTSIQNNDQEIKLETETIDYKTHKIVNFIMKKLGRDATSLLQYLQYFDKTQLKELALLFKTRLHEKTERKQLINHLLRYPFWFTYNIFNLFTKLSSVKEQRNENINDNKNINDNSAEKKQDSNIIPRMSKPNQSSLAFIFKQLPSKEFFVVNSILQKEHLTTYNEKNILKKVFLKLSKSNLLLLKFLTELPSEEIEKLTSFDDQNVLPTSEITNNNKETISSYSEAKERNVYIENAGLCLLTVYLPLFFKQLNYLEEGKFKNIHFAIKAIYLLQYLVSGETKPMEYVLQLNKLLCSFNIKDPIIKSVRLTKKEKLEADNLIQSVIDNWKAIKNTSIQGFRESFLKRKGILTENDNSWQLNVEKRGFDVLLDTLPWNFHILKLPWMKKYIHVEW